MRVLLVDENQKTKETIAEELKNSNKKFELIYANDGVEALGIIQEGKEVDLIVSDLQLPRMDGVTLLESLRERKFVVSFIIFSAEPPEKLVSISKSLQLNGWFPKSFNKSMSLDLDQLIKTLEKLSDKFLALEKYEHIKE